MDKVLRSFPGLTSLISHRFPMRGRSEVLPAKQFRRSPRLLRRGKKRLGLLPGSHDPSRPLCRRGGERRGPRHGLAPGGVRGRLRLRRRLRDGAALRSARRRRSRPGVLRRGRGGPQQEYGLLHRPEQDGRADGEPELESHDRHAHPDAPVLELRCVRRTGPDCRHKRDRI